MVTQGTPTLVMLRRIMLSQHGQQPCPMGVASTTAAHDDGSHGCSQNHQNSCAPVARANVSQQRHPSGWVDAFTPPGAAAATATAGIGGGMPPPTQQPLPAPQYQSYRVNSQVNKQRVKNHHHVAADKALCRWPESITHSQPERCAFMCTLSQSVMHVLVVPDQTAIQIHYAIRVHLNSFRVMG